MAEEEAAAAARDSPTPTHRAEVRPGQSILLSSPHPFLPFILPPDLLPFILLSLSSFPLISPSPHPSLRFLVLLSFLLSLATFLYSSPSPRLPLPVPTFRTLQI